MKRAGLLLLASCELYAGGLSGSRPAPLDDGGAPRAESGIEPDAQGPAAFVASHAHTPFDMQAADLVDPTEIDTTSLSIGFANASPTSAPKGIGFADVNGLAVLRVGVFSASVRVRVRGSRPLVVIAAKSVVVSAPIDASAEGAVPGPGGSLPESGPGAGLGGSSKGGCNPGGGGAGFGAPGGAAGTPWCMTATPGQGGPVYGAKMSDFFGGSGGGNGAGSTCGGSGGAGGGAIQLSSLVEVRIVGGGSVHAGGGAGGGGCGSNDGGGGGGGSGGTIFLEAPAISISGALAANGGGGGEGGASGFFWSRDGAPGTNALVGLDPAPGGASTNTDRAGGAGGARGTMAQDAPTASGVDATGGGGGAIGRIWIHARGAPMISSGKVSPAPLIDTSL
jgi:hypothetical protein